jgi:hypothetical protein
MSGTQATGQIPATSRGRGLNVTLWVLQVLLAFQFAMAGLAKVLGDPAMVEMFATIGIGQWFRYVVGVLELAGAVGVLMGRLSGFPAPQEDIVRYRERMGWKGPWLTTTDVFSEDFRTYFTTGRTAEAIGPVWSFLDLTRWGGRRPGKTRLRATRRTRRSPGGVCTTNTTVRLGRRDHERQDPVQLLVRT